MKRWQLWLSNSRKSIAMGVIAIILVVFTIYVIDNSFNNNKITGQVISDLSQSTTEPTQEQAEESNPSGCAYDNPPCDAGYICVNNECSKLQKGTRGGSGGGGGGGSPSVPPILDVGGY